MGEEITFLRKKGEHEVLQKVKSEKGVL